MMKVQVNITLDVEVAMELNKVKNKSALINSYLRHYFEIKDTTKEENVVKLEEAKEMTAIFEAKVAEDKAAEPKSEEFEWKSPQS